MKVHADRDFVPAAWMSSAEQRVGDARLLARRREAGLPRHASLFAGAAARFAMRAILLALGRDTRESDHLAELVALLPEEASSVKAHPSLALLVQYGPEIGYPDGEIPGLTWADAEVATEAAESFVGAIRAELKARGVDLAPTDADGGQSA
jgi:hypothetical protein